MPGQGARAGLRPGSATTPRRARRRRACARSPGRVGSPRRTPARGSRQASERPRWIGAEDDDRLAAGLAEEPGVGAAHDRPARAVGRPRRSGRTAVYPGHQSARWYGSASSAQTSSGGANSSRSAWSSMLRKLSRFRHPGVTALGGYARGGRRAESGSPPGWGTHFGEGAAAARLVPPASKRRGRPRAGTAAPSRRPSAPAPRASRRRPAPRCGCASGRRVPSRRGSAGRRGRRSAGDG